MGPMPASTVLAVEQEAMAVTFRQHTLLPLDDYLYALQATIPHLSRSAWHCCFQRHGTHRLPLEEDGPSPPKPTSPSPSSASSPISLRKKFPAP